MGESLGTGEVGEGRWPGTGLDTHICNVRGGLRAPQQEMGTDSFRGEDALPTAAVNANPSQKVIPFPTQSDGQQVKTLGYTKDAEALKPGLVGTGPGPNWGHYSHTRGPAGTLAV